MKYIVISVFCLMMLFQVFTGQVLALPGLSSSQVGAADSLIYVADLGNSNDTELLNFIEAGLEDYYATDVDTSNWPSSPTRWEFKEEGDNDYTVEQDFYNNWSPVTDSPLIGPADEQYYSMWAFDFGVDFHPDYFVIKTGKDATSPIGTGDHFLYLNFNQYAVIDLSLFDPDIDPTKISHLAVIPEPSTLILLGSGLVGLVWFRRRSRA